MKVKKRNYRRIIAATIGLQAYVERKEDARAIPMLTANRDTWLIDILTDLRHYAQEHRISFERCDRLAKYYYEEER